MRSVELFLAVVTAALITGCDDNCFAGDEEVPDRTIQLDEVVDARLAMCLGLDDVWDITLDPGQYRLEVQSEHFSWGVVFARDGESRDTTADQCARGANNPNCQQTADRKTLTFTVVQATAGHIRLFSGVFCETPIPDCPGHTYGYQLVVRRCSGNCTADAGP